MEIRSVGVETTHKTHQYKPLKVIKQETHKELARAKTRRRNIHDREQTQNATPCLVKSSSKAAVVTQEEETNESVPQIEEISDKKKQTSKGMSRDVDAASLQITFWPCSNLVSTV